MYKVNITKESLINHLRYDWWRYVLGIVVTVLLWNLGTLTFFRTPKDKKIEIFLVGEYMVDGAIKPIEKKMLKDFPELLEVNLYNIRLERSPGFYISGRERVMLNLASKTGDIYLFSIDEYKEFAEAGFFISLDEYIDEELQEILSAKALEKIKARAKNEESPHIYGIPMEQVTLFEGTGFNVRNKVLGIMVFTENKERALEVMKWILVNGPPEK